MDRRSEEDLRELDAAIGSFDSAAAGEYFGVRLMREGLERKRSLVAAESAGVLDLVLASEEEGAVGDEISLIGRVLNSLQESLASIAQVLEGEPTSRGLIPASIKDLVALRLVATAPGSLQMRLVPAHPETESDLPQMSLGSEGEDEDVVPLVDRSVDRLIRLLAHRPDDEDEELLQDLAEVGPRTTTHLEELSKALYEGGASASLSWRSSHCARQTLFTRSDSKLLTAKLGEVHETAREMVVTGRLVGGSLVHRRFELEPTGEAQGLIVGTVAEGALPSLELLFGQTCTATIDVREATLPSGETRESHFLRSLSE